MKLLQPLSLLLASSILVPALPTILLPSSTSLSQRAAELANSWHANTDDMVKRRYAHVDTLEKRGGGGGGGGGSSGSSGESSSGSSSGGSSSGGSSSGSSSGDSAAGESTSSEGSSGGSSGSSSSVGKGGSSSKGDNSNGSTTLGVTGRQGRCWYAVAGAAVIGLTVWV